MAKLVLDDVTVTIGATDYTDEIDQFEIPISVDAPECTTFDSAGWREYAAGMRGYQVTVSFNKDSDLSGLDLAIWTEIGTPTAAGIAWTGANLGTGATAANPTYSGTLVVTDWTPIGGGVGNLFEGSVTWQGTGTITRATS